MSKTLKISLLILVIFFIALQFIPAYQLPEMGDDSGDLIENNSENIPEDIQLMLKQSCYDCHSNTPEFPWYANIAPAKWLVNRDIIEGREELNFSEWDEIDILSQASVLDEMNTEVQEGEMPMKVYTLIHRNAKLSEEDKKAFEEWTLAYMESLFE